MSAAAEEADYRRLAEHFRPTFAEIAAGAPERERARQLPFDAVRWLAAQGFGALRVPVADGGHGASLEQLFRLLVELGAADSQLPQIYRTHLGFVESLRGADDATRRLWYPRVVAGDVFGNASTEPSGNVLGSTRTRLHRDDDGWRVTGRKFYSTGSLFSDWITVTATVEGEPGRYFVVVAADDPGVELLDDWDGFGQRLTASGTTVLDGARVVEGSIVARTDGAADGPAFVQLVLLATLAGIGRAALVESAALVRERTRVFNTGGGTRFRDDAQILQVIGEVSASVHAAADVVIAAARVLDRTESDPGPSAYVDRELAVERAHTVVPPLVLASTEQVFDALGASATSRELALDRHWRNARTIASHNPRVFKARIVGDYEVNGTEPVGLWGIGDLPIEPATTTRHALA